MKVLFLTTQNPTKQGDFLELTLVHGLRSVLREDFVEFPKKKILYGDFSESPRDSLHGKGFTFCSKPIAEIFSSRDNISVKDFDVVIHGSGHIYGEHIKVDHPNQWFTDGHDLYGDAPRKINFFGEEIIGTQFTEKCFKTSLVEEFPTVFPIGFGIPAYKIQPINLTRKRQLLCNTVPTEVFGDVRSSKYIFDNEEDYYDDLARSCFALTCKKGSWNQIRHLEAIAAGTVVLFKDIEDKPLKSAPLNFPTINFSTKKECYEIMNGLFYDRFTKPTSEYIDLLQKQRAWLMQYGTTEAIALEVVKRISQ